MDIEEFYTGRSRVGGQSLQDFEKAGGIHGPLNADDAFHVNSLMKTAASLPNFCDLLPLLPYCVTADPQIALEAWRLMISPYTGTQRRRKDVDAMVILADELREYLDEIRENMRQLELAPHGAGTSASRKRKKMTPRSFVDFERSMLDKNPSAERRAVRAGDFVKKHACLVVPSFDLLWRLLSPPSNLSLVESLAVRMCPASVIRSLTSPWVALHFLQLCRQRSPDLKVVYYRLDDLEAEEGRLCHVRKRSSDTKPKIFKSTLSQLGLTLSQTRLLAVHPAESFPWLLQSMVQVIAEVMCAKSIQYPVALAVMAARYLLPIPEDMVHTIEKSMSSASAAPQNPSQILRHRKKEAQDRKAYARNKAKK